MRAAWHLVPMLQPRHRQVFGRFGVIRRKAWYESHGPDEVRIPGGGNEKRLTSSRMMNSKLFTMKGHLRP